MTVISGRAHIVRSEIEIARPKSKFRRALTGRYLSWAAAGALTRTLPALSGPLHFYPRGVSAREAADRVLEDHSWFEAFPFKDDLARFIVDLCPRHDKHEIGFVPGSDTAFVRRAVLIRNAVVQGSTGSIVLPARKATVTADGSPPNWNFARPRRLRTGNQMQGLSIHTGRTDSYFHFLIETAWPLLDALERYGIRNATIIHHGRSALQEIFFDALLKARPKLQARQIGDDEALPVEEVLFLVSRAENREWSSIDRRGADRLANMFRDVYNLPLPRPAGRRVFLSRGNAKLRRVLNEAELLEIAARQGFEPFIATDDNHPDQIRVFSEASHVISVHGAGLTNLLFAPAGARVLEIFPSDFTKSTFAWMATHLGLSYQWIIGGAGDYDQRFTLDPTAFAAALDELLQPEAGTPTR